MSPVYEPYVPLVALVALALVMAAAILVLNGILGPKRPNPSKALAFESGNVPADSPRQRFDVKFYLVAIFFIVFDIEAVFLFPWAVRFRHALEHGEGFLYLGEMAIFLSLLGAGLVYVWKRGGLRWD